MQPGSIEKLFARDATACRRAWRFAQTRISENLVRFRCHPPRPIGSDTKVRGVEAPGYLLLAAKQRADLFGYPAHVKIGAFLSYKTSDFATQTTKMLEPMLEPYRAESALETAVCRIYTGSRGRWWARRDSNPQPSGYEPPALTIELQAPRGLD